MKPSQTLMSRTAPPNPADPRPRMPKRALVGLCLLFLLAAASTGCTLSLADLPGGLGSTPTPVLPYTVPPTPTPLPQAEVTFRVKVPADTPAREPIYVSLLDEVTGLALNPQPFQMEPAGANEYTAQVLVAAGSLIKYRYSRQGPLAAVEHASNGRPVRYRLLRVEGPILVEDVVSRWNDTLFSGAFGRIRGTVSDRTNGDPLVGILVAAGGQMTITAADGSYLLEGLPPGKHNVVAYALDGAYRPFQQEAIVAESATTPAPLGMQPARLVEVSFTVILPPDSIPGVPIRLAGNLLQLGNAFADLDGGISTLSNRMPTLAALPDGRQTLTLSLPAGTDLRYKYTLGDGFWNAEHYSDGRFRVRQLIVPEAGQQVEEVIQTWRAGNSAPIWFDVSVPEDTPLADNVSIQFNPYGWTQSLPMWRLEEYRWAYLLSSPLDLLGTIGYRYCRNDQCGIADDALTPGDQSGGRPVSTSVLPQTMRDSVGNWQWWQARSGPVTVPGNEITNRGLDFVAGVEFHPDFHPSWTPRLPDALASITGMGANWGVIVPSWTYTRLNPPALNQMPGQDPLWDELTGWVELTAERGLNVALRPTVHFPFDGDEWWATANRDPAWWDAWFERYRTFLLHHADLGAQENIPLLILGGDWLAPALPGGTLADGSPSGVPADAETRWRELLTAVRSRYGGTVAWALPYDGRLAPLPAFLDSVDQVYLLWEAPLASDPGTPGSALTAEAGRLLDTDVLPVLAPLEKPVIISFAYPSATGGVTGCLPDPEGGCLPFAELGGPNQDYANIERNLEEQVEAYNALLLAVNERGWIDGVVSRGFFPPAMLLDKSISVYGKPAADVLSYWFPRLRGLAP